MFFTKECRTRTNSSTHSKKEKKKGELWLFSKVELFIFTACSFSIFMVLSIESSPYLSRLLQHCPKKNWHWGGMYAAEFIGKPESKKKRKKTKEYIHSWILIQNIYGFCIIIYHQSKCWIFELGLRENPTHKSPSNLIILHYAQFHLQLPKQIVHPQVPDDAERHKTNLVAGRVWMLQKLSLLPTFHASTRWRATPEPKMVSN